MRYVLLYLCIIWICNAIFTFAPSYWWVSSVLVGGIFVIRDFAHKAIGSKWMVPLQLLGMVSTLIFIGRTVALASGLAFLLSEFLDFGIFAWTKKPFADRVLLSSVISVPIDTVVFFGVMNMLTPTTFLVQTFLKMLAAFFIWRLYR